MQTLLRPQRLLLHSYTVKSLFTSDKQILEDSNRPKETPITRTLKSSSEPAAVNVEDYIKHSDAWSYYSTRKISTIGDTVALTINGGEPFRLYASKVSGNDGECKFSVALY